MEENMLERFFDEYIANKNPQKTEQAETERQSSLLPSDELLHNEDNRGSATVYQFPQMSTSLQSRPQNATGAAVVKMEMEEELPPIITKIHNIMAWCKVGCCLDVRFIASHTWNVIYNPRKSSAVSNAVIMTLRKPQITAHIFKTGSVKFIGANSIEDCRKGARRVVRILEKIRLSVTFKAFKIHTLFASCTMFPVNLIAIQRSYPTQCSYEPEMYPALHFRVKPGLTLAIYHSGKITLAGARSPEEVQQECENIRHILMPFRRVPIK